MTDAAIGGKLGIDFQGIKNAVGVFKNPAAVMADPDFLATLPYRELRSGFAEVIKHAFIGDPALLAGYLGDGHGFAEAIGRFASAYADRNERDYERFVAAVRDGRFVAELGR